MKYLNTKYKLFLENKSEIHKYEIVEFTEDFTIKNVYAGEYNITIDVKRNEKLKFYFDREHSEEDTWCITGLRPIETLQFEKKKKEKDEEVKKDFKLSELWEGNFLLDKPMVISKSSSPFKIEDYI